MLNELLILLTGAPHCIQARLPSASAANGLLMTRRAALAFSATAACRPFPVLASNAGALAARAKAAERRQNEAMDGAPVNRLRRAADALDVADGMLGTAADGAMTAAKWGDFREVIAPGIVSVRVYCPKKGVVGDQRAAFLTAASEMDQFAYDQQLRNLKEKYPQGWEQFKARNLNMDVTAPTAALQRARAALDALLASAREEEWGVAVSIEL